MTLVVGVKYKDGIILGSDSQATLNRGVPLKKLNQVKLFELKHTKNKVIIGGAGGVPFISKAIEEIQNNVKKQNDITFSQIVTIAENSVLHVARWYHFDRVKEMIPPIQLQNRNLQQITTKEMPEINDIKRDVVKHDSFQQQQIEIKPVDVILIIAGFDEENEPQIYIVYSDGISEKQQTEAAIGSGAAYAEYILSQLILKDMNEEETSKIVLHAINEVRKIDPGVGGWPQLVRLNSQEVYTFDEEEIIKLGQEVEQVENYVQNIWHQYIKGDLKFEDNGKSTTPIETQQVA